jgi:16S rRNA (adenine1518-N6/adenine1519-N6)-dimethyltransferase
MRPEGAAEKKEQSGMNYDSPAEITAVLKEEGLSLKKRWGQNFLINRGAREKIIDLIAPQKSENLWEVGPGLGCLTAALLPRVKALTVFEIDRGLIRYLEKNYGGGKKLTIVQGDVLKSYRRTAAEQDPPDKVVGNLPYSTASGLLASFAENEFTSPRMFFTVQKELALRMTAAPGSKNYSSFSVLCQYAFKTRICFELRPGSFFPAPEVLSAVIELQPAVHDVLPEDRRLFLLLIRSLFASRRKTLRNNLLTGNMLSAYKKGLLLEATSLEGIDPGIRSENLPPEAFIRLSNRILLLHRQEHLHKQEHLHGQG